MANLFGEKVIAFTRFNKGDQEMFDAEYQAGIVISTYHMITFPGERAKETQARFDWLKNIEWGLLIMDEVQMVAAKTFRDVTDKNIKSRCKLGLTATLVKESDTIDDLRYLIGPKLYESNWQDLV